MLSQVMDASLLLRRKASRKYPVCLWTIFTEAQKKAYIIADNRMAMDAGWDEELLRVEIEALQAEAFDLSLTGFDDTEIADLFGDDSDVQEDDF